jgi:hypothetical protein
MITRVLALIGVVCALNGAALTFLSSWRDYGAYLTIVGFVVLSVTALARDNGCCRCDRDDTSRWN